MQTHLEKETPQGERRLTEYELLNVQHALDSEILGLKKCLRYAGEMADDNAKHLMQEHADIHHRRIDMMVALLDAPGDITKQAKLLLQTGAGEGGSPHA